MKRFRPLVFLLLILSLSSFGQSSKRGSIKVSRHECYKTDPKDPYYTGVDSMPEFGAEGDFSAYLDSHIVYYKDSQTPGFQARADYTFLILEDGSLNGLKLKCSNKDLEAELARVLSSMPKWKPGKCNGIAVPVLVKMGYTIKVG